MREKLIDLMIAAQDLITLSRKADFLIANDVVQVVRCKDCKQYTPVEGGKPLCALHSIAVAHDDFCSYGERKDNAD